MCLWPSGLVCAALLWMEAHWDLSNREGFAQYGAGTAFLSSLSELRECGHIISDVSLGDLLVPGSRKDTRNPVCVWAPPSDSHRSRQTFLDSPVSIFTLRVCTSLGQTCCPPLTGHSSSQCLPDGAPVSSLQLTHPWTPGESQSCPPTCFGSAWPLGQHMAGGGGGPKS